MSKILYIAPFCETSVLGESARNYVKCLALAGINVCIKPIGNKQIPLEDLDRYLTNPEDCDHLIIHSNPEDFQYYRGRFKRCVGITHLITEKIEDSMCKNYFDLMDLVILDSSQQINHPKCINIEPAFDKNEYSQVETKKDIVYKFLFVGTPTIRENMFNLVRAYLEEFRYEERVQLSLKLNLGQNAQLIHEFIKSIQPDLRKYNNPVYYPNIHINSLWLNRKELLEMYSGHDCFINLSSTNQYSRPFIDNLFLGNRCISIVDESSGSFNLCYGKSDSVDLTDNEIYQFDIRWMKKALREAFEKKKNTNLMLGGKNLQDFEYENVSKKLISTIFS